MLLQHFWLRWSRKTLMKCVGTWQLEQETYNHTSFFTLVVSDICKVRLQKFTASKILHWMNSSVDPCDDFYSFVCGNYFYADEIRSQVKDVSYKSKFKIDIQNNITEKDPEAFKLLQSYYNICMSATGKRF